MQLDAELRYKEPASEVKGRLKGIEPIIKKLEKREEEQQAITEWAQPKNNNGGT